MSDPEETGPGFETALDELERLIEDLERGDLELARAMASYERGVGLLARCQGLLEGAERSVALLTGVDAEGRPLTTPFDATASADREAPGRRAAASDHGPVD